MSNSPVSILLLKDAYFLTSKLGHMHLNHSPTISLTHIVPEIWKFSLQKYFCSLWQLRKLILRKRMCTIDINMVKDCSYKKFSTRKFKVPKMKISISMVWTASRTVQPFPVYSLHLIIYAHTHIHTHNIRQSLLLYNIQSTHSFVSWHWI